LVPGWTFNECRHIANASTLAAMFQLTLSRNSRMRLFILPLLFCFIVVLNACRAPKTTKTVKEVFNHEQFDTSVIHRLYLYDSLKNILVANIDTIFNYRSAKAFENTTNSIQAEETFFNFIYIPGKGGSSDKIGLETLPSILYSKVDNICRQLGSDRIVGFDLQRNKTIVNVTIKNNSDEETFAETQHSLTWNWDHRSDANELEKDSVLGKGWIYYIQTEVWKGR
jgi:hypothetical protein